MTDYKDIVTFWFGSEPITSAVIKKLNQRWFNGGDTFDREIASNFGALPEIARMNKLDHWLESPLSALALTIVLDQFPRNLYRKMPRAFAYDSKAREVLLHCLENQFHLALEPIHRVFLYLPFEHSEDIRLQRRCVTLFTELLVEASDDTRENFQGYLGYAIAHREVIEEFGRFPHRNATLGREPTEEEVGYLRSGGRRF